MPFASISGIAWIGLANAALGLAVFLCFAQIAGAAVYEFAARARARARIIRDADAAVRTLLCGR